MTTPEQLFFCKGWYVRKPSPNDPKSQRRILPFALIKYNKLEGNLNLHLDPGAHRGADHKPERNPQAQVQESESHNAHRKKKLKELKRVEEV